MSRKLLLVLAGMFAALSPIAIFSTTARWSGMTMSLSAGAAGQPSDQWPSAGPSRGTQDAQPGPTQPAPPSPKDVPVHDLDQVLRFDLTPDWIVSHWPRVSAGLAHLQLQGYRVPLVTGTAQDDLAGSLTYYFNPRQQLQRITFYGTTGNARKLVNLVTGRFGFVRRLVNDASVFLYQPPGAPQRAASFLWIRPARVVKASQPHRRFEVAFVIERPPDRP